jgi:RNA polymerase sigma factor (sigma-70 family)
MSIPALLRRPNVRTGGMMLAMALGTALSTAPPARAVTDISRYCTACWRNARLPADVWPDCTQEVFVRLLERLPAETWDVALKQDADEHRELVRAIDCVKKRVQRAKKPQTLPEEGVADRRVDEAADNREVLAQAAAEVLTDRQRQVLRLWAEGYEVPDIAKELNTTAARVSDEKYKAIRRLRGYLEAMAS